MRGVVVFAMVMLVVVFVTLTQLHGVGFAWVNEFLPGPIVCEELWYTWPWGGCFGSGSCCGTKLTIVLNFEWCFYSVLDSIVSSCQDSWN